MPDVLYVGLQEDDKIVSFGVDAGSGKLVPSGETPAAGAPSVFALSPDRRVLHIGYRGTPAIESCRIDLASGAFTSLGRVATEHWPTYLATDRAGKYLLSAHYQGGYAAVHPLGRDGAVTGPTLDRQDTAPGAHAILTDPSNRFAFVPHIARQNDNVLEPPKNIPGPNFIAQFRFDAATGRLSANAVQARPARADRSPTLLLPSHARSRLFLRRAGVQRDGLPRRSRHGHPRRRGNDALAARRCDRAQYLFADLSDAVGTVPLCRQPRPQQHRRVRRRRGDRAPDARRACADRGGPHRVRSGFDGDVSVRRGHGVRTSGLVPGRRCDWRAGPAGYLHGRTAARGGARVASQPLTDMGGPEMAPHSPQRSSGTPVTSRCSRRRRTAACR